jgi:ribosome maturation factor RimP
MSWQGRGSWQESVETALKGLGYELVDAERSVGGLLRVTIDHLASGSTPAAGAGERFITVDDCERATRQLQHVLEVEGVDYQRLEVSSPGLDRPLKRAADYERFAGQRIELTLKAPLEGRKRWQGVLQANGEGWRLVLPVEVGAEPRALDFVLDEVREARLVPVVDFRGRRGGGAQAAGAQPEAPARARRAKGGSRAPGADAAAQGRADADVDGGRIR